MALRWLPKVEGGTYLRPALLVSSSRRAAIIRFGRERHVSFAERLQGTGGIPIRWHYFFGGRLSIMYNKYNNGK